MSEWGGQISDRCWWDHMHGLPAGDATGQAATDGAGGEHAERELPHRHWQIRAAAAHSRLADA